MSTLSILGVVSYVDSLNSAHQSLNNIMSSTWAVDTLRRLSAELLSYQDGRQIASDVLESFAVSLELVYRELLMLQSMNGLDDNEERACELVRRALTSIQEI